MPEIRLEERYPSRKNSVLHPAEDFLGLLTSSPPQFGQILFISSVQSWQNVHSYTHIKAVSIKPKGALHLSHSFLISKPIESPPSVYFIAKISRNSGNPLGSDRKYFPGSPAPEKPYHGRKPSLLIKTCSGGNTSVNLLYTFLYAVRLYHSFRFSSS
jgi:hypothetical protein